MRDRRGASRDESAEAVHTPAAAVGKATRVDDDIAGSAFDGATWEPIESEEAEGEEAKEHAIDALAGDVATHAATERDAPEPAREQARAARPKRVAPSRGRAGRAMNINLAGLVDGTKLVPGLVRLVRAMRRDGLRVADRPKGLAMLEAVFDAPENAPKLKALTRAANLKAWLNAHVTAVVPTRETDGGALVMRTTSEVARAVVRYLKGHPGSKVLIDEAGKGRFELVRDVARMLSQKQPSSALLADLQVTAVEYRALRGRWGAYISAKPGGIQQSKKLRGTLQALRGAGAGAVLEGYETGLNPYAERDDRIDEAKRSLALLRPYIAKASLALGVDSKRLGIDEDKGTVDGKHVGGGKAQLRRIFLRRLRRVLAEAQRMAPGVELGSWVSRLDGDAAADDAELRALLG